jgi:16S rRNA (cytidine1402-2'-O)-methyltransferase
VDGKLVLVPTPIGNLGDITFRALEVLKRCDAVLAEDTRVTGKLLAHFELRKPLFSFHQHNEHTKVDAIIAEVLQGKYYAFCSDAGTPGISDPGYLLVRKALDAGITPEVLPGPTAFVPALVASGFSCDRFVYEGFLPLKKGRSSRILDWKNETRTVVLFESPHRIARLMKEMEELLQPERKAVIHREISKKFEERLDGSLTELKNLTQSKSLKGELVVILEGWKKS